MRRGARRFYARRPEEAAGTRSVEMTRYLISFDDGAMTFPKEELPDVDKAAHEVVKAAQAAGVWVFGGGLKGHEMSVVATDGVVTDGSYPKPKAHIGGFAIVDVPSREEALE